MRIHLIARIVLLIICFTPAFSGFAATREVAAQASDQSLLPYKIAFACGVALTIYGLYLSRKKKIVIFANLTDIAATVAIPITSLLIYFLCIFFEIRSDACVILVAATALTCLIAVVIATYAYNASINANLWGFLLALFIKLFLLALYICLIALILFNGSKRKGESEKAFRRRISRENKAYIAGVTALFGFLTYLGLWDKNFVSLKQYVRGDWGINEAA